MIKLNQKTTGDTNISPWEREGKLQRQLMQDEVAFGELSRRAQ
jgi:hypothetical protein